MSTFSKKVTSAVAGLAVVFSMVAPIAGVSAAYNAADAADKLATLGVIVDHSANKAGYRLADTTSRQELSKIIVKLGGLEVKEGESVFKDTNFASWAEKYAKALNEAGYAASNKYFNPTNNATKIEALKWVMDARGIATGTGDNWMANRVKGAVDAGIATAFTDYNADVSRGQVFIWAANAVEAKDDTTVDETLCSILGTCPTEPTTPTQPTTPTSPVSGSDTLDVSLSPLSPTSGVVAADTPRTAVLAFDVTAGASDVTLKEARLDYTGLSGYTDIDDVKMYIGNTQVSKGSGKDFNDKYIEVSFKNDTVIQAGKTQTVMVTAMVDDVLTNVSHQITLTDLKASAAKVSGDNVAGMKFSVVQANNVAKLKVKIDEVGGTDIKVGETVELADFRLEETEDNEDVVVKSMTFTLEGSMDHQDDISDIVLKIDGKEVASKLTVNRDEEVIVDLDYTIKADARVQVELMAKVTGSVGKTLSAKLTEVYAVGADTGINASLTGDAMDSSVAASRNIEGSEINVSFDKSDIDEAKPDAEEVKVGTLTLSTDGSYNMKRIQVQVVSSGTGVANIVQRLELDGKSSDNNNANSTATTATYNFDDISIKNETKKLPLTFDVMDQTALNGQSLTFTVSIVEVEDEDNNEDYTATSSPALSTILSTNSLDSKTVDIETASVTFTSTKVNNRILVLGNGVETVGYMGKINVGDADGIKITNMNFSKSGSLSVDLDDIIDTATLNIGGVTTKADVNATQVKFRPRVDIAAGADNVEVLVTLKLKDNQSVAANETLKLLLDTAALQGGDVEDSDGNDVASANVTVTNAQTLDTVTTMRDRGTFHIAVKNDPQTDDNVENTVLAGTNGVVLAEIEMEAEYEDADVKELKFNLAGDFSTTLKNVRIVKGSTVIAKGAIVEKTASGTVIRFENDFTVADSSDLIKAELVADLNSITGEGDQVSAVAGDMVVSAMTASDVEVKGESSNDTYTVSAGLTLGTDSGETIAVVPTMLNIAVVETLANGDAKIKVTANSGNNTVGSSNQKPRVEITQFRFIETGNSTDAYSIYKDGTGGVGAPTAAGTAATAAEALTFTLSGSAFETSQTYVITSGRTADATYALKMAGLVVTYDIQDNNGVDVAGFTGLTETLNSEVSLGSKTY